MNRRRLTKRQTADSLEDLEMVAFSSSLARNFGENVRGKLAGIVIPRLHYFEEEISSRILIPLFIKGSVHTGTAS